jgi:hypothetical protein
MMVDWDTDPAWKHEFDPKKNGDGATDEAEEPSKKSAFIGSCLINVDGMFTE